MIKKEGGKWCLYTKDGSRKLGCHDTKAKAEAQERAIHQRKNAEARSFRGAVSGVLKSATFEGREHLVVPVVALVEGVIHPVNSTAPELVLAEEFAKVPDGWNGEPVLWDHPQLNGRRVPANEPIVLERMAFGRLFHTKIRNNKLATEAWLDLEKAEELEDAQRVLKRLRADETVEVSVGVFVETEDRSGEHGGRKYQGVWRHIVPDHLALLPEGAVGACSVEMGCGAPRAAKGGGDVRKYEKEFVAACALFAQDGQSDQDLRDALDSALRATEPGYYGVIAVYPDDNLVVYGVAPEEEFILYRRGFKIKTDGAVNLADKKEEVHAVTRFEPVTASATCGGCGQALSGSSSASPPAKDTEMEKKKKDRVAAIIATEKTCFKAEDAPILEQLSDERLTAMEQHIEKVKAAEADAKKKEDETKAAEKKKAEDEAKAAAAKAGEKTPEQERTEFFAKHPDIEEVVTQHKAAQTAKKNDLVASLKEPVKASYTEEELKALSVEDLEKLAGLVLKPKPDFTGAGGPRKEGDDKAIPAPPDMKTRVLAMRERKPA